MVFTTVVVPKSPDPEEWKGRYAVVVEKSPDPEEWGHEQNMNLPHLPSM